MLININNQEKEVDQDLSVTALLALLNQSSQGIAVAINQKVIRRSQWEEIRIEANDSVLIIKATCGG